VLLLCNDLFTPSHLLRHAAAWRSPKEARAEMSKVTAPHKPAAKAARSHATVSRIGSLEEAQAQLRFNVQG
jgi:hypothetical protein